MKLTKLYLAAISLAATLPTQATEQLAVQASAYLHGKKVFEETKLVDADGAVSFGSVYPFNPQQTDVSLCGLGFYSQQALTPLTRIEEVSPPGIHTRISFNLRLRPQPHPDYHYLVELQAGFITERTLATPVMEALFWGESLYPKQGVN